jgi:hypothetical protein
MDRGPEEGRNRTGVPAILPMDPPFLAPKLGGSDAPHVWAAQVLPSPPSSSRVAVSTPPRLARQARDTALILGVALDRGMNLVRRPVYVGDKRGSSAREQRRPKTHRLAGLAMRKRPSPDFVGYWILT